MYALYKDQLEGEYTSSLGVWSIKVNESDISSGDENLTFNMTEDNLTYIDSEHVKSQKLAPGTQAYFDIVIDPTNTDVSILYTLTIKLEAVTTAKLKLVNVENWFEKSGETEQVINDEVYTNNETNEHEAIIPLTRINEKYTVPINWNDNEIYLNDFIIVLLYFKNTSMFLGSIGRIVTDKAKVHHTLSYVNSFRLESAV